MDMLDDMWDMKGYVGWWKVVRVGWQTEWNGYWSFCFMTLQCNFQQLRGFGMDAVKYWPDLQSSLWVFFSSPKQTNQVQVQVPETSFINEWSGFIHTHTYTQTTSRQTDREGQKICKKTFESENVLANLPRLVDICFYGAHNKNL